MLSPSSQPNAKEVLDSIRKTFSVQSAHSQAAPGERDRDHQRADAVVGASVPGEQPDAGEPPADHQVERYPDAAVRQHLVRRDERNEPRAHERRRARERP
jgi:hypothetical protein